MLMESVIRRLRASSTRFERRVAGLAEFERAKSEQALPMPAAFVLPLKEATTEESATDRRLRQFTMRIEFVVATFVRGSDDPRGQFATHEIDGIRDELFNALVGWRPDAGYSDVRFREMNVGSVEKAWIQFNWQFAVNLQWSRTGECLTTEQLEANLAEAERAAGRPSVDMGAKGIGVQIFEGRDAVASHLTKREDG